MGSTAGALIDRTYSWADSVNPTGITENAVTGRNETYAYTAANRLQSASGPWGSETFGYDLVGNRTSETLGSTVSTYNYPSGSNRLASVMQGATTLRSLSYDGAGNVIADSRSGTSYTYTYNNHGRLAELAVGGTVTADYTYDGLERMAIRSTQNLTPAGTTHYIYDRAGHLLAEASSSGTPMTEYVWLDDLPLAVFANLDTSSPSLWYVHVDHLNRPTKMTDGSRNLVWDAIYWPFGAVYSINASATNTLRFPGQYFLLESGLHYNWYRHYDPTLGRYLQSDPVGFYRGPSLYAYVGGNPVSNVDPLGLLDVNIWNYRGSDVAWGHSSIRLDNGTYITWWPGYPINPPIPKVPQIYSAPPRLETYDDDVRMEGQNPDVVIRIEGLDEAAIQEWWNSFKGTHKWRTLAQNCSTTVRQALVAGGGEPYAELGGWLDFSFARVWTPADVNDYANSINRGMRNWHSLRRFLPLP